ncbi:hypothetical protein FB45DRAFT_313780 [Roridomyces roridus]|uniref:DUF6697 domain-containing protein n=1 Tax=Roridomyces roridus TaxID=1738132 RepID=A0AAD7B6S9_9AGAR|nr:hypothetical protein FB45DRAFT_313780 [Roridomyces roridus]
MSTSDSESRETTPSTVLVTPELTQELVEFWGFKYQEMRQELDDMKAQDNRPSYGELVQLVQQLQEVAANNARRLEENDRFIRDTIATGRDECRKLEISNNEKNQLLLQLRDLDAERSRLCYQSRLFYSQAVALAAEAARHRMSIVSQIYTSIPAFDPKSFFPAVMEFPCPTQLIKALPPDIGRLSDHFYFLPRPPLSMSLNVLSPGRCGYWFAPFSFSQYGSTFDLVTELEPNKWTYFGKFISRQLTHYDMRLSEWLSLDEEVKIRFCDRIAGERLPTGQHATHADKLHVRECYDSGQWAVPCYALQCVGYDKTLHDILRATAATIQMRLPSIQPSLGKRRRAESPSMQTITLEAREFGA